MKKSLSGMLLLVMALGLCGPVRADSMRCGTKLLTDGDPLDKVEALCGPPASIERREILRPYYNYHNSRANYSYEVSVEIWTYNFGPHKLMYRLRFEDGLLIDVDTLSHGYHSANTGG